MLYLLFYSMGLDKLLALLQIETRNAQYLPKLGWFNLLQASLQWNEPVELHERKDADGKQDFLYLIRPLLDLMQKNFLLS